MCQRLTASIVSAILLMGVAAPTSARADDASVGAEEDGYVEGVYVYGDQPNSDQPRRSRDRSPDSTNEEQEDIAMYVCDGEVTVGSPYDCPGYVPPPDLDRPTAEQLARRLIVRLQLPKPTPQFGPDPSVNEWNMAAVGYPLWLWTEGPETVTSTQSAYGLTFTLRASYRYTTFEMGDGHTRRCTETTPYRPSTKPGTPSPTCGYTYLQPAEGDGKYTVTATTHWDVDWSVAGFSGTLPGTHSANRTLPVGELQAIVVK